MIHTFITWQRHQSTMICIQVRFNKISGYNYSVWHDSYFDHMADTAVHMHIIVREDSIKQVALATVCHDSYFDNLTEKSPLMFCNEEHFSFCGHLSFLKMMKQCCKILCTCIVLYFWTAIGWKNCDLKRSKQGTMEWAISIVMSFITNEACIDQEFRICYYLAFQLTIFHNFKQCSHLPKIFLETWPICSISSNSCSFLAKKNCFLRFYISVFPIKDNHSDPHVQL